MPAERAVGWGVVVLTAGACMSGGTTPGPVTPDTLRVVDTVLVQQGDRERERELEEQVSALTFEVLEREAQIADLTAELNAARQEVVRAMASLQTMASRAEAASAMAESEIAIGQLRNSAGDASAPELTAADQLLQQATDQFNADNFGGALYLANQARTTARRGLNRFEASADNPLHPGEQLYTRPLDLAVSTRSNVRSGPGLDFPVQFTLDAGAAVTGISSANDWVRVRDQDGRTGWMYRPLLEGRSP